MLFRSISTAWTVVDADGQQLAWVDISARFQEVRLPPVFVHGTGNRTGNGSGGRHDRGAARTTASDLEKALTGHTGSMIRSGSRAPELAGANSAMPLVAALATADGHAWQGLEIAMCGAIGEWAGR